MNDIVNYLNQQQPHLLHLVQSANGSWYFVGRVPVDLMYAPGYTEAQLRAAQHCGEAFGPKKRIFKSKAAALRTAKELGYIVDEIHS